MLLDFFLEDQVEQANLTCFAFFIGHSFCEALIERAILMRSGIECYLIL